MSILAGKFHFKILCFKNIFCWIWIKYFIEKIILKKFSNRSQEEKKQTLIMPENNKVVLSTNMDNYCNSCTRDLVKIANLMISSAYSNRYMSELLSEDEDLQQISKVLQNLSGVLHLMGRELIAYMLEEGINFYHFDPMMPVWTDQSIVFYALASSPVHWSGGRKSRWGLTRW